MGHATGHNHPAIRRMVDQVIRDSILSTLPYHDARRMPVYLTDVTDVIVIN